MKKLSALLAAAVLAPVLALAQQQQPQAVPDNDDGFRRNAIALDTVEIPACTGDRATERATFSVMLWRPDIVALADDPKNLESMAKAVRDFINESGVYAKLNDAWESAAKELDSKDFDSEAAAAKVNAVITRHLEALGSDVAKDTGVHIRVPVPALKLPSPGCR